MTSTPDATVTLPIRSDLDLAWARQQVRQVSDELGFGLVQQTKLVTAASELARNTLVHGGGGEMDMAPVRHGATAGLRLTFTDHGPGIPDVDQALSDGFTTGGGLGLGLGGARRLGDPSHRGEAGAVGRPEERLHVARSSSPRPIAARFARCGLR